jgi:adenine/guanine phosphoribosyltransferase-like PRPP-binding protein
MLNTVYLHRVFTPTKYKYLINKAAIAIKELKRKQQVDLIAFTGVSGAALAFPLAYKLNMPILCIRKDGDKNHSNEEIEGNIPNNHPINYIIIDDCIYSGATIDRIKKQIKDSGLLRKAKLKAIFLYSKEYKYRYNYIYDKTPIIYL